MILFIIYIHIFIFLGLKCCYYICSFNNEKDILDFLSLKKKIEKSFILLFLKSKKKMQGDNVENESKRAKNYIVGRGRGVKQLKV